MDANLILIKHMGVSEEAYYSQIFESGCAFIEGFKFVPADIKAVLQSKSYWAWWKNHWNTRNKQLIADLDLFNPTVYVDRGEVAKMYHLKHNLERLDIGISRTLINHIFKTV